MEKDLLCRDGPRCQIQPKLRFSLAALFGAISAVAVFCGLLRYSLVSENYVIAGEMAAGLLIMLIGGLVWIYEEPGSLLQILVVTLVLGVALADVMGICGLLYTWAEAWEYRR